MVLLLALIFLSASYAFGITPSKVEVVVTPNEKYCGEYQLSNSGNDQALCVYVEIKDWEMSDSGGVTMLDQTPVDASGQGWFRISSKKIIIPPNGTKKIKYTVVVPAQGLSEYRKYLIFRSGSVNEGKDDGVGFSMRIVSPFYAIVKGSEIIQFEVSDLTIKTVSPVQVDLSVHNAGNIHIRPTGVVTITKKGEATALLSMEVNTPYPGWPILPGKSFRFSVTDKKSLDAGEYILEAQFTENGRVTDKKVAFTVNDKGELPLAEK